jgi:imidazole glycerol-phosphate synthase subunit HisH
MLAVVDYGAGNLRSVMHALKHLHAEEIQLVREPSQMEGAEKIILPGVGAFGAGMQKLEEQKLVEPICERIKAGIPYLGICLGMQFLFDYSDEMGEYEGFGILSGKVTRFPSFDDLKVPHMGWNTLTPTRQSVLLENIPDNPYAYFVHSYYCIPNDEKDILITVDYGLPFTAAVERDTVYGVQFHPEKSQQLGLQILSNFLAL